MATSTSTSSSLSFFSSTLFPKTLTKPQSKSLIPQSKSLIPFSLSIHSQLTPLPILSPSGDKTGETFLNLKTASPETARAVVHRAVVHHLQNRRRGTASTLTRAEVRGGGVKPYPQKKTGRARRGSQRTPLRPGGGVVFGPKPKDWTIKMNRKEKRLALSTAINSAVVDGGGGGVFVVEGFGEGFTEKPKTKEFIAAMRRWGMEPSEKAVFFMMEEEIDVNVEKSGRNIGSVKMLTPRSLNIYDILNAEKLVFSKESVEYLNEMYGVDYDGDEEGEDEEDDDGEEDGFEIVEEEDEAPEAAP